MPIDMSAAKAPPKKSAPRTTASTPRKAAQTAPESLAQRREYGLNGFAQSVQSALILGRQYAQAATVGTHLPGINVEVAKLADDYKWLATGCDFLIKAGPLTLLAQLVIPFVAQTAANYGFINAEKLPPGSGIVPPRVLEAQVEADIARMQAEMLRQQQQALADAAKAKADYEAFMSDNGKEPVPVG